MSDCVEEYLMMYESMKRDMQNRRTMEKIEDEEKIEAFIKKFGPLYEEGPSNAQAKGAGPQSADAHDVKKAGNPPGNVNIPNNRENRDDA